MLMNVLREYTTAMLMQSASAKQVIMEMSYSLGASPLGYLVHMYYLSDIDECATGTHDCSADAVCNNTRGSFNCTCKPEHYGDGQNCIGIFCLIF